jgi:molybdopterin-guanine dinucleotide biosynthesis protein A
MPESSRRENQQIRLPAILLAGGDGVRMGGGDKCLCLLGGKPLLAHVIHRVRPQASALVLSANGNPERFAGFNLPVAADATNERLGPLAGILAGLDWVATRLPEAAHVLVVPTDCPFLPEDLASRLTARTPEADIALAASGGRVHPVVGLWRVNLRDDLRKALTQDAVRKVERFCDRHRCRSVEFPARPVDPFFNVNSPGDLGMAEKLLRSTDADLAARAASLEPPAS